MKQESKMDRDFERIRDDLAVLEGAAGLRLPFDERDVRRSRLYGLLGLPLAAWGAVGTIRPPWPGIAIFATLVAILILSSRDEREARSDRRAEPLRWREHRIGLALFLAVTTGTLGYLLLAVWNELSWQVAMGTMIFFAGVAMTVPAIVDRARLHMVGSALPTMVYGAVFPLGGMRLWVLETAAWIVVSGFAAAGIMRWQLRRAARRDDAD